MFQIVIYNTNKYLSNYNINQQNFVTMETLIIYKNKGLTKSSFERPQELIEDDSSDDSDIDIFESMPASLKSAANASIFQKSHLQMRSANIIKKSEANSVNWLNGGARKDAE